MHIIKDKQYLVTGGSGFLGAPLIKKILEEGGQVRVIARNEGKLVSLKQKFPTIEIFPGDISDKYNIKQVMKDITGVFHLAAAKHVGLAETHARGCIQSNTIGSMNILEESLETKPEFVLSISTDKAAQVSGVYGASKLLMERLHQQFERINPNTHYRIVRYGNVIYSTGSVLCKWKDLLKDGKGVIVTDLRATRFFWTRDEAIDLIFECLKKCNSATPYVPEMKSMDLGSLLEAMAQKYLPKGKKVNIKIIGLQAGENLHEKILESGKASNEVERYTIEEILEKI